MAERIHEMLEDVARIDEVGAFGAAGIACASPTT
jgi:hypothetical protein